MIKPTVVIIDDDPEMVSIFLEYLQSKNVEVPGCGYDGKDAVNLYRKHMPDIVFLDLKMPQYDGFYALSNIRKINPNAKIVIITGDISSETSNRLRELNPNKILYKPFEIKQVISIISELTNSEESSSVVKQQWK